MIVAGIAVLVAVVPCSIVGCTMMLVSSARMRRIVREYNAAYIFGPVQEAE